MKLDNQVVFVSGTNRGIGKAIIDALIKRKVKRIYASARNLDQLPAWNDPRVVCVDLDITSIEEINKPLQKPRMSMS